jgi:hypothetical protein
VETLIEANAPIMAILTGGVYAYGALGIEGLTRESVAAAFDANGFLKPCLIVKQRAAVPDLILDDMITKESSTGQALELWIYEDRGYSSIDSVLPLLKALLHGTRLTNSFPLEWSGNIVERGRDEGALSGHSMARQDWQVIDIK